MSQVTSLNSNINSNAESQAKKMAWQKYGRGIDSVNQELALHLHGMVEAEVGD